MPLVFSLPLTLALLSIGVYDLRTHRVPNAATGTLLLAGVGYGVFLMWTRSALASLSLLAVATLWIASLGAYALGIVGGGDAKLVMGLAVWFPTWGFARALLMTLMVALVLVTAITLARGHTTVVAVQRDVRALAATALGWLHAAPWPSAIDLRRRPDRRPMGWLIALAGLVYLWSPAGWWA
jgi:prepilin peptidase CpaA